MTAPRMLVIAPHPDDETLGVGGTMARFSRAGGEVTVLTVAAHMPPLYSEAVHAQTIQEARCAHNVIGVSNSIFLDNPAALINEIPSHVLNKAIDEVVKDTAPDILLIPFYDRHYDHRIIFDSAMVASRPVGSGKSIMVVAAYEVLSETHWNAPYLEPNFAPNWVVDVSETIDDKLNAMACYKSQVHPFPAPRSLEALRSLALFRGSQAGVGYGEGFYIIRMAVSPEALAWFHEKAEFMSSLS